MEIDKTKKITRDGYDFVLRFSIYNNPFIPVSGDFTLAGQSGKEMTEEELKKGHKIQQNIFDEYNITEKNNEI